MKGRRGTLIGPTLGLALLGWPAITLLAAPDSVPSELVEFDATLSPASMPPTRRNRPDLAIGPYELTSAPWLLAQSEAEAPSSADDLFGLDEEPEAVEPGSADDLFGLDEEVGDETDSADDLFGLAEEPEAKKYPFTGFFQNELGYAYPSPDHYSKFKNTLELSTRGRIGDRIRWVASGRLVYDPIYELTNFYSADVEDDQELELTAREIYADISAGDWDFRLGRQHIVWGEMVGVFLADVVSAKDQRESLVQDFDLLRIPQNAARAEYFQGDLAGGELHAEAIWIPIMEYDDIGEPGAEFFPFPPPPPPGFASVFAGEEDPSNSLSNSGFGVRGSFLKGGWDTSLFFYSSLDARGAFERTVVASPSPAFVFRRVHDRIDHIGATVAKDFDWGLLKAEALYSMGRPFEVTRLSDPDGLVHQDTLQYIVGWERVFAGETHLNLQFFQAWTPDNDPDVIPDELESGFTVYLNTKALHPRVEPELLWIRSLDRNDWLLQAKVKWEFQRNWWTVLGVDIWSGPPEGFFGQYDSRDRVYYELRYSF